ncbi:precorrin-4 C(11)-methyltransferase [Leptospira interrogans]|uniref:Precorrin-4 C(11)-methyltransferase n=1 Tax=Leptospira interrogans serovar Bataviae TaxID=312175 RepID=A0AAP9WNQ2_LEPIR|nr:precorrin-4 C(11)-methyltransferase [Leptospira interrogans]QOI52786.1 precorrin-4 C(11)-methyltransferase [Leptospira interrogans serovar Bataviae]
MKVYIIGAGPGDPELITIKGAKLIEACPIVLYTGSLVPKAVIERTKKDAIVLDSSSMTLDEIISVILSAKENDQDVARVHTGDPSIFGSIAEQIRKLDSLNIQYEIVPGVSSFTAAAAVLGKELTLPEVSQTIIITRISGRTPVPERERLEILAQSGATLTLFLSVLHIRAIVERLTPYYGEKCPVAVIQKATWPEQKVAVGTLDDIVSKVKREKISSTAIIFIGPILDCNDFADSRLYSANFSHGFRKAKRNL